MQYDVHVIALIVLFALPMLPISIYSLIDAITFKSSWDTRKSLNILRFFSLIPFGFYGGLALNSFLSYERRRRGSSNHETASTSARVALGLHGVIVHTHVPDFARKPPIISYSC